VLRSDTVQTNYIIGNIIIASPLDLDAGVRTELEPTFMTTPHAAFALQGPLRPGSKALGQRMCAIHFTSGVHYGSHPVAHAI
jgi:hypothetical protein